MHTIRPDTDGVRARADTSIASTVWSRSPPASSKQVRSDHPGLPLTLVGHSMGGLVVAATAAFHDPEVEQIVLSGALLELDSGGGGLRRSLSLAAARILSSVTPRIALSTGLDTQGLSRDPEVIRRYEQDPYVKDRMSVRFAAGLSSMVSAVRESAARIDRPMLILHGGADPISPVGGSRDFFARLRPEIAAVSALEIYPELRHEIFQEPERRLVWQDMLDWLEKRPVGTERSWQTS